MTKKRNVYTVGLPQYLWQKEYIQSNVEIINKCSIFLKDADISTPARLLLTLSS